MNTFWSEDTCFDIICLLSLPVFESIQVSSRSDLNPTAKQDQPPNIKMETDLQMLEEINKSEILESDMVLSRNAKISK